MTAKGNVVKAEAVEVPMLLPSKAEAADPTEPRSGSKKRARKEEGAVAAAPRGKKSAPEAVEGEACAAPAEGEKQEGGSSWLVVAKTVKTMLKSYPTPMHCGADALPALNAKISELINEAVGRALANGRKTLKNSDF